MGKRNAFKGVETLHEAFNKVQMNMHFEQVDVQNEDEKFLAELVKYIRENISSPDLSVEALSCEMKMSRVWLYRKILMLTGKSPIEFIRAIRLQKAVLLLGNPQMSIGRIASEVGFDNPPYFSKIFKKEYDILPSIYIHFARKTKAQAILNDYALTSVAKTDGYCDSGMSNQKL
ncbi:helix-turn-helix domain-containing protein [Mucilaginibacter sp. OK098]|uniref:helix-turn-helix domain-containing protein n=1 Tax=Mucilaginibacter sp. OK098 TaxID=1855297 RepID=UPI0009212929|nr:AraC family transcriptional regulator [Mucilaginibacter sp. OK098]SHM73323.1 AraC-type DNA-binding protein [Mucilaginibacter sp. OK098]